ncbi:MAG: transposase [Chloroflexia bacterium]|nr:transposase [Chloroflexia bacterium]
MHILLRREGWRVNHKRVYRLYREEGLGIRVKRRKKLASAPRALPPPATRPHERWSMDFLSDRVAGRCHHAGQRDAPVAQRTRWDRRVAVGALRRGRTRCHRWLHRRHRRTRGTVRDPHPTLRLAPGRPDPETTGTGPGQPGLPWPHVGTFRHAHLAASVPRGQLRGERSRPDLGQLDRVCCY